MKDQSLESYNCDSKRLSLQLNRKEEIDWWLKSKEKKNVKNLLNPCKVVKVHVKERRKVSLEKFWLKFLREFPGNANSTTFDN